MADGGAAGTNLLAVVAFGAALLLGFLAAPVAIPMAYVARRQISSTGQSGLGLVKATLVISYIYLALGVVVLLLHRFVLG